MTATHTRRGKETEQAAARWFRANGFDGCERVVRTGYRQANREMPDGGDLDLSPGAIAQVKSLRPATRMEREIPAWMSQTEQQRRAARADIALLVVRREHTSDVGEWWAWLPLIAAEYLRGSGDGHRYTDPATWTGTDTLPLRLSVADAARLLRAGGYGTPLHALTEGALL